MAIINTADDLLRLLRENAEFREAVRRELLTEELLELPKRFAEYAKRTDLHLERIDLRLECIEDDVKDVKNDVGYLKGGFMELALEKEGLARIVTEFDIRNIQVLRLAEQNRASADFDRAISDAEESGLLDLDDYNRLLMTDMIIRGRSRVDRSKVVYVAAEASYTVEEDDIAKVSRSALAIRKVFPGDRVYAALYCENLSDDLADKAMQAEVRTVIRN